MTRSLRLIRCVGQEVREGNPHVSYKMPGTRSEPQPLMRSAARFTSALLRVGSGWESRVTVWHHEHTQSTVKSFSLHRFPARPNVLFPDRLLQPKIKRRRSAKKKHRWKIRLLKPLGGTTNKLYRTLFDNSVLLLSSIISIMFFLLMTGNSLVAQSLVSNDQIL